MLKSPFPLKKGSKKSSIALLKQYNDVYNDIIKSYIFVSAPQNGERFLKEINSKFLKVFYKYLYF